VTPRLVLRRCVSCRQLIDRDQLWRVVRLAGGGGIQLDRGQGRSAYVCADANCLEDARRRKRLQRALRAQVADSILESLESRLNCTASASSEAR